MYLHLTQTLAVNQTKK